MDIEESLFKKSESLCFKKCGVSHKDFSLNEATQSCLHRCSRKFLEAVQFGHDYYGIIQREFDAAQPKKT